MVQLARILGNKYFENWKREGTAEEYEEEEKEEAEGRSRRRRVEYTV